MKLYRGEIYLVTNKITGDKYVGLTTVGVKRRWTRHIYNSKILGLKSILNNAIRKYGEDAFSLTVLKSICSTNRESLNKSLNLWEVKHIELFDSFNNGYNMNIGGGAMTGYVHCDEYKKKMSLLMKNRVVSDSTKEKLKGRVISEENKQKLRLYHLGRPKNEEAINKMIKTVSKPVIQTDLLGNFIMEYPSAKVAGNITGIKIQNISAVCLRDKGTAGKYKWKYKINYN
jgi:group I intron endonuclease